MNINVQRRSLVALPALLLALSGVAQVSSAEEAAAPAAAKPTMGERVDQVGVDMSDSAITAKVKGAFLAEKTLKVLEIHVETKDGVVALSGKVDSQQDIERAKELAAGVKHVKSVTSTMVVKAKP